MKKRNFRAQACAALAAALLSACGGGGSGADTAAADLQANYNTGLAPASATALGTPAFQDSFAANYMDSGMTRAQLLDAFAKDSAAAGASADFSLFPAAKLSDISISNCNASNVCTLTGTLTNSDADTTTVPFTTQVLVSGGTYRLLGDQQAS